MRAVVQRTLSSSVWVENKQKASIDKGLIVLLGVKKGDTPQDAEYLMEKIINLRIFEDQEGKMNLSLLDSKGAILLVSQFTLYGDVRKGRRPSFSEAEEPARAAQLIDYCSKYALNQGILVKTGVFGANMVVHIENDGPCTILLDSEKIF